MEQCFYCYFFMLERSTFFNKNYSQCKATIDKDSDKIVILPEIFEDMKFSIYSILAVLILLLIACGPSDEEKARVKVGYAKMLLEQQDTIQALQQLDSVARLYPKAPYSISAAKNLINEINFSLLEQKENELDSLKMKIIELEKPFVKEKTEFDRYARYTHKRQTLNRSITRSFLQIYLDERGEMYLSSNYHGENWLNHVGLRVYDKEISAKTDSVPIGDVNNHRSDFMEYKWEKVTYRNGKDNGVIQFIADNADRRLKAVFLGKELFYIILEDYDKQAVKDALALSKAILKKKALEAEIKELQQKLQIS